MALTAHSGVDLAVLLVRLYLNRLSGPARSNDREVLDIRTDLDDVLAAQLHHEWDHPWIG